MMMLKWGTVLVFCLFFFSACMPAGQARKDEKQQADVHYKMATAHLQANNPTMALKELLIAAQQDPENSTIHVTLAQAYQQKKAYILAERHYQEALRLSQGEPRYQNNLAALYLDMKRWDQAIEYFDKAAQNLLFADAHISVTGKGFAFFNKGDYDQALVFYQEAAELSPRYAPAYYYQAEVYQKLNQPRLEKIALQRAVDISPQFLQARFRFAELLLETEDVELARQQLETIIEFSPQSELGLKAVDMLRLLPD